MPSVFPFFYVGRDHHAAYEDPNMFWIFEAVLNVI